MVIRNSKREAGLKSQNFKGKYEAKLEIPGGWEGLKSRTILGGGMDIFWNHRIRKNLKFSFSN